MGLYKITCKKTGSYSEGQKLEKGMSVEIIYNSKWKRKSTRGYQG
jgi:hypothetical protein